MIEAGLVVGLVAGGVVVALFGSVVALLLGMLVREWRSVGRKRHASWRALAERQGWQYEPDHLTGTFCGRSVRVRVVAVRKGKYTNTGTSISVGGVPVGLSLEPRLAPLIPGPGVGDPQFDFAFLVRLRAPDAVACVDESARTALLAASREHRFRVSDGRVVCEPRGVPQRGKRVLAWVEHVAGLAELLAPAGVDPADRLEAMAQQEPTRALRLDALDALAELRPDSPVVREVVFELLSEDDAPGWVRAARLCRRVALPGAPEALLGLLRPGGIDPTAWSDAVVYRAQKEAAVVVAEALGGAEHPGVAEALLGLLAAPDIEVRVAAVTSLGAVGTVDAVRHIAPYMDTGLPASALRRAASAAVAAIQERAGGEAGQLSLAVAPGGGLSLASDGRLSMASESD